MTAGRINPYFFDLTCCRHTPLLHWERKQEASVVRIA